MRPLTNSPIQKDQHQNQRNRTMATQPHEEHHTTHQDRKSSAYLNKQSLRSQCHSKNKQGGIFSLARLHFQLKTLTSSTTMFGLKEPFAKIVLFLAFQIEQSVACQIIKKPWRTLLFFTEPLNI
jgi:hypothetical protein